MALWRDYAILIAAQMNESRTAAQPLQLYRLRNRERTAAAAPSDHDCVVALKALAEETRVRIVSLLIDVPIGRRMAEGGVLDLGCCSFQFEGENQGARPQANGRRRRTARR